MLPPSSLCLSENRGVPGTYNPEAKWGEVAAGRRGRCSPACLHFKLCGRTVTVVRESFAFHTPHPVAISGIPGPIYICLDVQPGANCSVPAPIFLALKMSQNSLQDEFLDSIPNKWESFLSPIFLTQLCDRQLPGNAVSKSASLSPAVWCSPVGSGHLGVG